MIDLKISIERPAYHLSAEISLPTRGITGLVGPSGSGKTSLLRVIAGLETPTRGQMAYRQEVWFEEGQAAVAPAKRRVGMVFQDMRLFQHLTVRENLELAAKWGKSKGLPDEIIAALELPALLERRPEHLSGGEARRAALARALAQAPRVLLLDEPLSGLDPAQKARVLPVLARAIDLANIPAVFVSHDPDEVGHLCKDYIEILEVQEPAERPDLSRRFVTSAPKAAGPQIVATWQGTVDTEGRVRGCVKIGDTTIDLPETVNFPRLAHGAPVILQGSFGQSFLAPEDVIPPKGVVKIPATRAKDGRVSCGGRDVHLPDLAQKPSAKDQTGRTNLYFRPVALFHGT